MTSAALHLAQTVAWLDFARSVLVEMAKRYPEVVVDAILSAAYSNMTEEA